MFRLQTVSDPGTKRRRDAVRRERIYDPYVRKELAGQDGNALGGGGIISDGGMGGAGKRGGRGLRNSHSAGGFRGQRDGGNGNDADVHDDIHGGGLAGAAWAGDVLQQHGNAM